MNALFRKLRLRSDFARGVLTLMSGTVVTQAIPVAISPILTRIYSPEDFGTLALFFAITSVLGSIATGRYELAIMLPETDEDAANVAAVGLLAAVVAALTMLVIIITLNDMILGFFGNDALRHWLYVAPLVVFFSGLFNILVGYNNRIKKYGDIARSNILRAVVMAVTQIVAGLFKMGAGGLILGQVLSSFFANGRLLRNTVTRTELKSLLSWSRMKALAYRYRDFPKYSLPAILANSLSLQLTNVLVARYFAVSTLGHFALVQRTLGLPSAAIGSAISQVYYQQATAEKRLTGAAIKTFRSTLRVATLLSIPSATAFYFFAGDLFALVFGETWRVAGEYAKILAPFYAIRFIASSVSTTNSIFEKQRISLYWQISFMIAIISSIIACGLLRVNFYTFASTYTLVGSIWYTTLIWILSMTAKGRL